MQPPPSLSASPPLPPSATVASFDDPSAGAASVDASLGPPVVEVEVEVESQAATKTTNKKDERMDAYFVVTEKSLTSNLVSTPFVLQTSTP